MSRFSTITLAMAGLAGLAGVSLGAWGAHGFSSAQKAWIETASQYALFHALAMGLAVVVHDRVEGWARRLFGIAAWFFAAGIVLFSGSLVLLALNGKGGAAPVGGTAFLVGWALFFIGALSSFRRQIVSPSSSD